ncbi:MAG TPA: nucleotidyl transferase AbiEii/AbiGii toxin family protein [Byssovorax sp.]|jgi:hypothetical protein
MKPLKPIKDPSAARQVIEGLIKKESAVSGMPYQRVQRLFLFEALAVRLAQHLGSDVVVKGGFALELRGGGRSTKDIDVRAAGDPERFLRTAQEAAAKDIGDFLSFELTKVAEIEGKGVVYGGTRLLVKAAIGKKEYGSFRFDVGVADRLTRPADKVTLRRLERFGVAPIEIAIYPCVTHIAEKLHAYTLPRASPSRVKDLPDIAVLATIERHSASALREAINVTFAHRGTHDVPAELPAPPEGWDEKYAGTYADELEWATLSDVFGRASAFLNPVLAGIDGDWSPEAWSWEMRPSASDT